MSLRSVAFLATMLSLAPLGLLSAQQAAAPAAAPDAATAPAAAVEVTPAAPLPQPQYSPLFEKSDPAPALGTNDHAAMASEGKNHTIVLSTLAIVLMAVLLAVLIF